MQTKKRGGGIGGESAALYYLNAWSGLLRLEQFGVFDKWSLMGGGRFREVVAHGGWTIFFVREKSHTVVKLSAEVRFSFHRGQTRELLTRYCQYPVTLLNILKVYVFNKKSVVGKRK